MSHAIRLRISEPNAPADALDRIRETKEAFRTVLGPGDEVGNDQETEYAVIEPDEEVDDLDEAYIQSILRFDERDGIEAIIDEIHESQFPSIEWYVLHVHDCTHEYAFEGDLPNDYPDGETGPCDGWEIERERGDVPEPLR